MPQQARQATFVYILSVCTTLCWPDMIVDSELHLQVVFEEGIDRKVIFSSFDPDVATLARLKQPRYPVRPSPTAACVLMLAADIAGQLTLACKRHLPAAVL